MLSQFKKQHTLCQFLISGCDHKRAPKALSPTRSWEVPHKENWNIETLKCNLQHSGHQKDYFEYLSRLISLSDSLYSLKQKFICVVLETSSTSLLLISTYQHGGQLIYYRYLLRKWEIFAEKEINNKSISADNIAKPVLVWNFLQLLLGFFISSVTQ